MRYEKKIKVLKIINDRIIELRRMNRELIKHGRLSEYKANCRELSGIAFVLEKMGLKDGIQKTA